MYVCMYVYRNAVGRVKTKSKTFKSLIKTKPKQKKEIKNQLKCSKKKQPPTIVWLYKYDEWGFIFGFNFHCFLNDLQACFIRNYKFIVFENKLKTSKQLTNSEAQK